jgi:hypothetical protein
MNEAYLPGENQMTKYYKIGLPFGLCHAILFLMAFLTVISSEEAQIQLIYIPLMVADLPISLLYAIDIGKVGDILRSLGHPWLANVFYPPLLINGILGSLWWYFLPKFFLPKRYGGIWGARLSE